MFLLQFFKIYRRYLTRLEFFKWTFVSWNRMKCFCKKKWWNSLKRSIRMTISTFDDKEMSKWIVLYCLLLSLWVRSRRNWNTLIHNKKIYIIQTQAIPYTTKPFKGIYICATVLTKARTFIWHFYVSLYF